MELALDKCKMTDAYAAYSAGDIEKAILLYLPYARAMARVICNCDRDFEERVSVAYLQLCEVLLTRRPDFVSADSMKSYLRLAIKGKLTRIEFNIAIKSQTVVYRDTQEKGEAAKNSLTPSTNLGGEHDFLYRHAESRLADLDLSPYTDDADRKRKERHNDRLRSEIVADLEEYVDLGQGPIS
jgi:hypothetical protein